MNFSDILPVRFEFDRQNIFYEFTSMKKIEYNPDLFLSYDPNYLIIEVSGEEYVFYNSIRHFACKINKLELLLLNALYKYGNIDYITKKISIEQQKKIKEALQRLINSQILSTEPLTDEPCNQNGKAELKTYYLHLTYRCNLNCSYCYNKTIRVNRKEELAIQEWERIVDKITADAHMIVLTGGECFLYKDIVPLLKYIREKASKMTLSCISNCMHDFSSRSINRAFEYLDEITFSCDSISKEGERKGFNPEVFRKNIEYIKTNFPHIKISISKTNTIDSEDDTKEIRSFCNTSGCNFTNIILNPSKYDDIEMMPPITDYLKEDASSEHPDKKSHSDLGVRKMRCGAAKNTCSIDPVGNVYPCQCLHFEEFLMGNLLEKEISELRYQDEEECVPCIDEIPECAKCKVKYICGGGCFASGYELRKNMLGHNKWLCPYNYNIAIKKLLHIENQSLTEDRR